MATSSPEERTLTISGVKVVFPCKPYPSQFSMMDKVIKGLERRQNSLLESPTGSGKSLALLCSALAWQNAQHKRIMRDAMAQQSDACCKPCQCKPTNQSDRMLKTTVEPETDNDSDHPIELSDDEDFRPAKKSSPNMTEVRKRGHVSIAYEDEKGTEPCDCTCGAGGAEQKKKKVPKIYFGTRTHKQIAQITRELRKTAYHDARMVILASREYTCIHKEVTKLKNKSEGCREKLDIHGPGCKYNDRAKRVFLSQGQLQSELPTAWDLEDLVSACTGKKACPYFVTRNVVEQADIVFCPYNYLIDPLVRKSMDISLKDQIVILDEAHNIEDSSRDAASGSITTEQISNAIHNLQELLENNVKFPEHLKIRNMLDSLLGFLQDNLDSLQQADYDNAYKVWSGFDIVARLKNVGLGPDTYKEVEGCFEAAMSSDEDVSIRDRRNQLLKMNSGTAKLLEQVFQILHYMYKDDMKYVEDYRVCILKSMQFVPYRDTGDRWLGKNRRGGSRVEVLTLNFWCMNPAVAFSDFSVCRNVVLSSGTLSPMSTFASELGTEFPIQLEANHIVEDKQVSVNAIGVGPSGHQLQAVYRNMETFPFQDELGALIHRVCLSVPHGVLCFLPSYRALQKFVERWKLTGLWKKLCSRKRVMIEPRSSDKEEFDGMMKAFYDVVGGDASSSYLDDDGLEEDASGIDGALFFAVCRGKVSEGMDFADNNARAVITVGIPFPNFKDLQVKLKREYNDRYRAERGLLSGDDWYEIQAFRALNQALGRCIRHRKDWGALIMVDDRFVKNTNKYIRSLSRWIRCKVRAHDNFTEFEEVLEEFTQRMQREMPVVSADSSFIPSTPIPGRRDSVYKRQSLDVSVGCSPSQTSQYFSRHRSPAAATQPCGSPYNTGNQLAKGNNSVSPSVGYFPIEQKNHTKQDKGPANPSSDPPKPSPTEPRPTLVYKLAPSTLPPEEQLRAFLSSRGVPKTHPYYVVCNEGKPNESAFFIEPNLKKKTEQVVQHDSPEQMEPDSSTLDLPNPIANQSRASTRFLTPVAVPQTSGTALPIGGTAHLTGGTALPTGGTAQFTGQTAFTTSETVLPSGGLVLLTGGTTLPSNGLQNTSGTALPSNGLVPLTGGSVLPSSGTALPSNRLVSLIGGTVLSAGGKPSIGGTALSVGGTALSIGETALSVGGTALPSKGIFTSTSEKSLPSNGKGLPTGGNTPSTSRLVQPCGGTAPLQNKFVKFCQLPLSDIKPELPIATVTPQKVAEAKQEPAETGIPKTTAASPVLFDAVEDCKPAPLKLNSVQVKKPIFKKRGSEVTDVSKCGDAGTSRTLDAGADTDNDKTPVLCKGEKRKEAKCSEISEYDEKIGKAQGLVKTAVRGKNSKSVTEKLRMFRRQSTETVKNAEGTSCDNDEVDKTILQEKALANLDDSILDGAGSSANSDEEFLNTRRRGSRKRKSTAKFVDWDKRSKKVVKYEGGEDDDSLEKENNVPCKQLTCANCGKKLLKLTDYERRKRHPAFVDGVFKKNTELLYFCDLKLDTTQLAPLTARSDAKGVKLNSIYDSESGCCTEFLHCVHCVDTWLLGVRVLLADSSSTFKTGQTWLLSSAVKML